MSRAELRALWADLRRHYIGSEVTNITGLQFPSHDPPVAWHAGTRYGFPAIAYPAMPERQVGAATDPPRYMDPEPVILDGEPGRRP